MPRTCSLLLDGDHFRKGQRVSAEVDSGEPLHHLLSGFAVGTGDNDGSQVVKGNCEMVESLLGFSPKRLGREVEGGMPDRAGHHALALTGGGDGHCS